MSEVTPRKIQERCSPYSGAEHFSFFFICLLTTQRQYSADRLKMSSLKQWFPSYGLQGHDLHNSFKCIVCSTMSSMIRIHPQTSWMFNKWPKKFFLKIQLKIQLCLNIPHAKTAAGDVCCEEVGWRRSWSFL